MAKLCEEALQVRKTIMDRILTAGHDVHEDEAVRHDKAVAASRPSRAGPLLHVHPPRVHRMEAEGVQEIYSILTALDTKGTHEWPISPSPRSRRMSSLRGRARAEQQRQLCRNCLIEGT